MLWIGLVIALGLLVGTLIVTYGYRHSVLIVAAVLGVLIVALAWYIRYGDEEGTGLITSDELVLKNLSLRQQYRTSYRMTGRLVNNSERYTVRSVAITITASDCTGPDSGDCIVVGEDTRTHNVEIPPGQARDILEQYIFPRFVLQGELRWSHDITQIKAGA